MVRKYNYLMTENSMCTGSTFLSNSSWNVRVRLFIHVYDHGKVNSLFIQNDIY